jgi:hypothetical protein
MNSPRSLWHPRLPTPLVSVFATVAALAIAGCSPVTPSTQTASATPSLTGNWQIQAGSSITPPPFSGEYLVGALQVQGPQVTGTFTGPVTCSLPVHSVTGSYDPSTGNLSFYAIGLGVQLVAPTGPNTSFATGSLIEGGGTCQVVTDAVPSVGVEIAPVTGTYTGTLTAINATSPSGTATLVLTQSSTPNSSGAFPLTGTMAFPASGFPGTYPVAGTISGEGITLNPVTPPGFFFGASTNPAATQIAIPGLAFGGGGLDPALTFTGTLTLQ